MLSDDVIKAIAGALPDFIWREGSDSECGVLEREAIEFARAIEAAARREALEEAARHILSGGYMSPDACAKAIRAMMETPQGVSTQPAPSEPHHIPDATKMVSDALPELPEPAIQVANHTGGLFGYTAAQMHAHYRKGWADALANWPSNQRQRIETLELEKKTLLEQLAQSADAKDAARYRWLRDNAYQMADCLGPLFRIDVRRSGKTLFNFGLAVDAAMQGKEGEE